MSVKAMESGSQSAEALVGRFSWVAVVGKKVFKI